MSVCLVPPDPPMTLTHLSSPSEQQQAPGQEASRASAHQDRVWGGHSACAGWRHSPGMGQCPAGRATGHHELHGQDRQVTPLSPHLPLGPTGSRAAPMRSQELHLQTPSAGTQARGMLHGVQHSNTLQVPCSGHLSCGDPCPGSIHRFFDKGGMF